MAGGRVRAHSSLQTHQYCIQYYLGLATVIKSCLFCLMAIKMAQQLVHSEKYLKVALNAFWSDLLCHPHQNCRCLWCAPSSSSKC